MPKMQQRDFYFGAALSMFFKHNKDTRPSIIETIENSSQIMKMTTNTSDDFYVFMKYTADKKLLKNDKKKAGHFLLQKRIKQLLKSITQIKCRYICSLYVGIMKSTKLVRLRCLLMVNMKR